MIGNRRNPSLGAFVDFPSTLPAMDRIRSSALQVGLVMGLIFVVVGLINDNYGIVGLGVVVVLAGYFSRKTDE